MPLVTDAESLQQSLTESEKKANTYMKRYSRVQVSRSSVSGCWCFVGQYAFNAFGSRLFSVLFDSTKPIRLQIVLF